MYAAIERLNVDHVYFPPNRDLINRLARKSLSVIGDSCWSCHAGIAAFAMKTAVAYKIPLLVWGESLAEASARTTYYEPVCFDRDYWTKTSAKVEADKMVCEYISKKDVHPFELPDYDAYEKAGIRGVYIGDYMFWDEQLQTELVIREYGWKETEIEGTFKRYKSAECIMAGMHDFTCYLKRGFGRASVQASVDVRQGLLTREEGFELARRYDPEIPHVLDYYLKITGFTEKEFYAIMEQKRVPQLRGIELPMITKTRQSSEVLIPFAQQLIDEGDK